MTRNVCNVISAGEMKDKFLKFAFLITAIVVITSIISNLSPQSQKVSEEKKQSLSTSEIEKIKKLIQEGQLSDKEAMFYNTIR